MVWQAPIICGLQRGCPGGQPSNVAGRNNVEFPKRAGPANLEGCAPAQPGHWISLGLFRDSDAVAREGNPPTLRGANRLRHL